MNEEDRKLMREEIAKAIKECVNGKIDNLRNEVQQMREEHEAHMEEIKPFIQAKASASFLYKAFLWLGSLAVAWLAVRDALPFKF